MVINYFWYDMAKSKESKVLLSPLLLFFDCSDYHSTSVVVQTAFKQLPFSKKGNSEVHADCARSRDATCL